MALARILYLALFAICALYGCFASVGAIRKVRAARAYRDARLTWSEPPGFAIQDDLAGWLATSIHWTAVIALGVVVLLMVCFKPFAPMAAAGLPDYMTFLLPALAVGSTCAIGAIWGQMLFGPVAEAIGGDRHYAVSDEGLLFGGRLWPWPAFGAFSYDQTNDRIYVWSATLPATLGFGPIRLAQDQSSALLEILRQHLPAREGASPRAFGAWAFAALMAVLSVPLVALGLLVWLAWRAPIEIALIAELFIFLLLMFLGSQLIMGVIFGGKARPALLEQGPA